MPPWRVEAGGVAVLVRLTPRAARDAIEGVARLSDGRDVLAARVRAVPERGAANAALEALLAEACGVPKRAVRVTGGTSGRLKTVAVRGDAGAILARLAAIARPRGASGTG